MQAYSRAFARVYNERWIGFAERVAPSIRAFYENTPSGAEHRSLLDVCCGTGHLALHFLARGYTVIGVDLSEHMLRCARENAAPYVESGQAKFIQADAADFTLDGQFGLAVSTFDALNHLPDKRALRGCFQSVYPRLLPGGFFLFDLNTLAGRVACWNGITVQDSAEFLLVNRGIYDKGSGRAWTQITGFLRTESGLYERFAQTVFNTAFDLAWVREALLETGWRSVHFARIEDLSLLITEPEGESRAFIVARK
ncbi:MAG: class I SAM-dependent methyltransferase [Dehalococcoidia bacterium]|nr:MAG: class I SAM-dependent methyltransferase [Dehalococcoidia bacterium]